jgi:hypothetical protein
MLMIDDAKFFTTPPPLRPNRGLEKKKQKKKIHEFEEEVSYFHQVTHSQSE